MFCKKCGQAIPEDSKFCSHCGADLTETNTAVNNSMLDKEALKRKISRLIDKYNIYPDVSAVDRYVAEHQFDGSYADNFDPFYRLNNLKTAINDCLLETTEYKYDIKEFEDVINDTYFKREIELKEKIRDFIFENYCNRESDFKSIYDDIFDLRKDEFTVYFFARLMARACHDIKDPKGLIKARIILKRLDEFYCEKNTDAYYKIYSSGHMLSLNQFSRDKNIYDSFMKYIENAAIEINPKASELIKEYIDEDNKLVKRKHNKRKKQSAISIIVRIILALLSPLFLYLSYNISSYLGADFAEIPLKLTLIVAAVLCIIIFICDIIYDNIPIAFLITTGGSALLYPICWLAVAAVQFLVIGLIIFVICFTSIGSSRL